MFSTTWIFVYIFLYFMLMAKMFNAYNNREMIHKAIERYNRVHENKLHDIYMESFWKTVLRFWDWGYVNICGKYVTQMLEPYINRHDMDI